MKASNCIMICLFIIGTTGIFIQDFIEINVACIVGIVTSILISKLWLTIKHTETTSMERIYLIQAISLYSLMGVYCLVEQDSVNQLKIASSIFLPMLPVIFYLLYRFITVRKRLS